VGSGKVNGGAGKCDAMLGVLEGASEGDDEVRDGANSEVPVANASKRCGVVGERKGMWRKLCGVTCEATDEVVGLLGDGREE
jgi:hypothetical protein